MSLSAIDPAFVLGATQRLRVDPRCDVRDAARFLAVRVAHNPQDLRLHLQRVHLFVDSGQADRLFAAVIDLWVTLGAKGRELRAEVIRLAEATLDAGQLEYLRTHLDAGLNRNMTLPVIGGSVLDRGLMGSFSLVKRERVEREFDEARAAEDPFYVPEGP